MSNRYSELVSSLCEDEAIRSRLLSLGFEHDNLQPLAEAYVQFLTHAGAAGAHPTTAVRAFWIAHRETGPAFQAFESRYPELVVAPPSDYTESFEPRGYATLYAAVARAEPHFDRELWPKPVPPRYLGLTDREAKWLYGLAAAVSLWLIYLVATDVFGWPLLLMVVLFAAFAGARHCVGRTIQEKVPLTAASYQAALIQAQAARPLSSYVSTENRMRSIIKAEVPPIRARFRISRRAQNAGDAEPDGSGQAALRG